MALSYLLRGVVTKSNAYTLQVLGRPTVRLSTSSASSGNSLSSVLSRAIKKESGSAGLVRVQPYQLNKVQRFSVTPKRFSGDAGHNHSKLWTLEKVLSAGLLLVLPAALISPNKVLDTLAAVSIVMHSHWGLEAIVVDYVRPILFGNAAPKIALGALYLFSILTMAGLLHIIYNDIGLANTVKKIWSL